jgi:D-sedoheptulose 7-phosphate isomerase
MGRTVTDATSTALTLEQIALENIAGSIAVKQAFLGDAGLLAACVKAAEVLSGALRAGRRAFLMGNGGSAADAQHIAAELVGRYKRERRGLPVMALTVNTSCLTAIGNDYSYEMVFARQIEAFAARGDVAIGISTSGNSRNVVQALAAARKIGARTIGLAGRGGGQMRAVADVCLCVPSDETPRIQESHILIGHILSDIVERELFEHGGS